MGITVDFEFEIGEIVYAKYAQNNYRAFPMKMMIVERLMVECSGGIQKLYRVSEIRDSFNEITLTRDRPKYEVNEEKKYASPVTEEK